jgi:hypothetical protein
MCIFQGVFHFIIKADVSPIPSLIIKADVSLFIMKADTSLIPYIDSRALE